MTAVLHETRAGATPQWALRPPRIRLGRVFLTCGVVLGLEIPVMLWLGDDWRQLLLPGYAMLVLAFGAVFCLAAVTAAGFVTGAAAAGLIVAHVVGLPVVLAGAAVLAVLCGLSPGWSRVESWQAARTQALTAGEEAGIARRPLALPRGRHRVTGPRARISWRSDRVVAAFLVLAYPPCIAAFSVWFVSWAASR